VYDQLSVTLEDADLLDEMGLTTDLIIAASSTEIMLPPAEVDRLLGVVPASPPIPGQVTARRS